MQSFFEFLVSVINHYHINGLHLFWDSFEWLVTQNIFPSCPRHCDRGLIVIVYYFQIWKKTKKQKTKKKKKTTKNKNKTHTHNIIISRVISSHMDPVYIESSNIWEKFL